MNRIVVNGVRTVGVPVSDQDRAVAFYVERFGLVKTMDTLVPELGSRWIEVSPAGGGISLALVAASEQIPAGVETGIRLTTADAAGLYAQLSREGVDLDDFLEWPGVPAMFALRDPDGNGLEVVGVGSA